MLIMNMTINEKYKAEEGFTLVELLIVIMISVILLAGMVALVSSVFGVFESSKDLQALNDSSRRALSSISRQLKTALHFDNTICNPELADGGARTVKFWADVDNDQAAVTINDYKLAEEVVLERTVDQGVGKVTMTVTNPAADPTPGVVTAGTLGSYVSDLRFYFFGQGVMPEGSDPTNPTGCLQHNDDINADASMVRVVITLDKGDVSRTYYRDVFLRVVKRLPDY